MNLVAFSTFLLIYLSFFLPGFFDNVAGGSRLGKAGFVDPQIDATVNDMKLLPDGKIIVAGRFSNVAGQQRRRVARLNVDGTLDATFADPQVTGIDATNTRVNSVEVQPDGKLIIAGSFDEVGGASRYSIARLEPDGTLDVSFSADINAPVTRIALQNDGRILIGGYFTMVGGQPRTRMARLNTDGTLDASFQNVQFTSPNPFFSLSSIATQADGKILIGGDFSSVQGLSRQFLVRLESNGLVDASFSTVVSGPISTISVMLDGRILICGFFSTVNTVTRRGIARLFSDGSLDKSLLNTAIPSGSIFTFDLQADGKVMVGGNFSEIGGVARNSIARLNSDGSTDTSFEDPNAIYGGSFLNINVVIAQPDGKTLIGGSFATIGGRPRRNAVRLLADGSLDLPPPNEWIVTKIEDSNDGVCDSDCSLREAISAANSSEDGSQIVFDPSVFSGQQTIVLQNGELFISNSRPIFLTGPETGELKISGNSSSRILRVGRDALVEVSDISMENGNGIGTTSFGTGGAIFVEPNGSFTRLTLRSVKLRFNSASFGGAIGTQGISYVSISNSLIEGNFASGNQGGGVHFDNGTLSISSSTIIGNSGGGAGGITLVGFIGSASITNTLITGNSSAGAGGIAFRGSSFRSLVEDSVISNNLSASSGGGVSNQGITVISNSIISGNSANSGSGNGGGVFNFGVMSIVNSTISENNGSFGAGIYTSGGLTIQDSEISGNNALNGGGGVYNNAGGVSGLPVVINGSMISENTSEAFGGGIYNRHVMEINDSTVRNNNASSSGGGAFNALLTVGPVKLVVERSTFSHNVANGSGGAILNQAAELSLINSTLSLNHAKNGAGGAVFLTQAGQVESTFSTIAFNTAELTGGIRISQGAFTSNNSIIANNTSKALGPDFFGELLSTGHNLIGNTQGTQITGDTTTNILNTDPLLTPVLRTNGGATETHGLLVNSPAIDAGNSPSSLKTDQRGFSRPIDQPGVPNAPDTNAADIGAFELQGVEQLFASTFFDFDGDGKTDASVFRPNGSSSGAEWWYLRSSDGGNRAFAFGGATDEAVPADYTGDGKTDIAFWRASTGSWFILRSEDSTFYSFPFGSAGDVPMPADFDGDGKADQTVFRPSTNTWFTFRSSDGQVTTTPFGAAGDLPVAADYDGDGKADIAIYRPVGGSGGGEWWYLRSSDGANRAYAFGSSTDRAVPGDYTGDGKADLAFWRPSTGEWFVLRSEDDTFYSFPFGISTDVPVPGDYDGDGKADAAVFRPSNNIWYLLRSTAGFEAVTFGANGDVPLPNSYVR